MRGDGVGVGDIDHLSGVDIWFSGDTAGDDDGRKAGRKRDAGVVGRFCRFEYNAMEKSRCHWFFNGDGARGEHGACDVHGTGSGGAHGMRGDAVGVGDIR